MEGMGEAEPPGNAWLEDEPQGTQLGQDSLGVCETWGAWGCETWGHAGVKDGDMKV